MSVRKITFLKVGDYLNCKKEKRNCEMSTNQAGIVSFISEHKAEFEQKFGVRRIGIFGSYARGEANGNSDIDIVVELEKPDMFHLVGIKNCIELAFGRKVDVVRLIEKMNMGLRRMIERDAVYI